MTIVSQYKKRVNFENAIFYQAEEGSDDLGYVTIKLVNNDTFPLGIYESYERACEVVEELDSLFYNKKFYNIETNNERIIAMNTLPKIYYMPEE